MTMQLQTRSTTQFFKIPFFGNNQTEQNKIFLLKSINNYKTIN